RRIAGAGGSHDEEEEPAQAHRHAQRRHEGPEADPEGGPEDRPHDTGGAQGVEEEVAEAADCPAAARQEESCFAGEDEARARASVAAGGAPPTGPCPRGHRLRLSHSQQSGGADSEARAATAAARPRSPSSRGQGGAEAREAWAEPGG